MGRTKIGRLWVYVRDDRPFCGTAPPAATYFYSPDRSGEHPAKQLASFTGFLQADAYAGFEALYRPRQTQAGIVANAAITEVACWAHCRRKFHDVWVANQPAVAKETIDRIRVFYDIEDKARLAPPDERRAHRAKTGAARRRVLRVSRHDREEDLSQVRPGRGVQRRDQAARCALALPCRRAAGDRQ